ncbi:hypothetical protein YC2023_005006 [Brassica napus]
MLAMKNSISKQKILERLLGKNEDTLSDEEGVQVTVWRSRVLELTGVGCLLAVCFTGSLTLVTGKCTILFLGTHNMYHRCNMF